jgi:probable HAF family extracellular repeat protein
MTKTLAIFVAMNFFAMMAIPKGLAAQQRAGEVRDAQHHRYKLVDIGTFGGPASYINAAFALGAANQINERGAAVGSSATSIPAAPDSNLGVCDGIDGDLPFVFHAFHWQNGALTDLGALPGENNSSCATSINKSGEIVGRSEIDIVDPLFGVREFRAVLWKDGEIHNLGTFGGKYSLPGSINNRGQVAGSATNAISDPYSLLYQLVFSPDGTQTRAFLWENGHKRDLGTLGGPDAQAGLVNDDGQVGGISFVNSTPNSVTGFPTLHPFLWHKGKMKDLGTLGGFGSPGTPTSPPTVGVSGLNNRGQVIGLSPLAGDQIAHPFLWDDGNLVDLTVQSGGLIATADAINDAGQIVGNATFPNGASDAYLWQDGVITDLGALAGDCFSRAFAINSRGQVVGQSFSCATNIVRSFLWENGSMVDLNSLIPPNSNLFLDNTLAINDHGEISGLAVPPDCANENDAHCGHAYVLLPCDRDHSNDEGCEEQAEATTPTIQAGPAPVSQVLLRVIDVGATPKRIASPFASDLKVRSFGIGTVGSAALTEEVQ